MGLQPGLLGLVPDRWGCQVQLPAEPAAAQPIAAQPAAAQTAQTAQPAAARCAAGSGIVPPTATSPKQSHIC